MVMANGGDDDDDGGFPTGPEVSGIVGSVGDSGVFDALRTRRRRVLPLVALAVALLIVVLIVIYFLVR
jgi:hypothetical protein